MCLCAHVRTCAYVRVCALSISRPPHPRGGHAALFPQSFCSSSLSSWSLYSLPSPFSSASAPLVTSSADSSHALAHISISTYRIAMLCIGMSLMDISYDFSYVTCCTKENPLPPKKNHTRGMGISRYDETFPPVSRRIVRSCTPKYYARECLSGRKGKFILYFSVYFKRSSSYIHTHRHTHIRITIFLRNPRQSRRFLAIFSRKKF